jgi:hypothetical protein
LAALNGEHTLSYYLNFRSQSVGGGVISPYVLEGDGGANPWGLTSVDWNRIGTLVNGKNVLFAVHGFNVSFEYGARSLGQLEPKIAPGPSDVYFGVLWPGDYWIPAVNYPFEGEVAIDCGRRLADFCKRWLNGAQSISFVSHSLGARLVLEAVKYLDGQARVVCLTAAAINQDCLSTQYAGATAKSSAVSILASHNDWVLGVAYRVGDPIAEILNDDHTPFQPALGYDGPPTPAHTPICPPWQIPDGADYGHHDYLPPGDGTVNDRWLLPAGFMARAFHRQPQTWP